jgi:hypothetical protein
MATETLTEQNARIQRAELVVAARRLSSRLEAAAIKTRLKPGDLRLAREAADLARAYTETCYALALFEEVAL